MVKIERSEGRRSVGVSFGKTNSRLKQKKEERAPAGSAGRKSREREGGRLIDIKEKRLGGLEISRLAA